MYLVCLYSLFRQTILLNGAVNNAVGVGGGGGGAQTCQNIAKRGKSGSLKTFCAHLICVFIYL